MVPSPAKLAYRVAEVCDLAGVSRWVVEQAIAEGAIRTKRVGRALLLDPRDVSQVFGFAQDTNRRSGILAPGILISFTPPSRWIIAGN